MAIDGPADQLLPGDTIVGRYRLVERCGSGGMGSVWRATHLALESTVAIKFLHGSVAGENEARVRFEQEAKLGAKLGDESSHVVRVMDHGVTETGRPFLVMELLEGESLSERLERDGKLSLSLAASITAQLCRALHFAHVAGVIHRDLKPANVFLSRATVDHQSDQSDEVFVKLLDFGVAKATLDIDARQNVTRAGFIVGTPAYMSPEQITAEKGLDTRADLWSVAAIAYRMVVGAPPFGTGTIAELGPRICVAEPRRPSKVVVGLPPAFDGWIARGLAKGRDDRFQTTTDLADALSDIARPPPPSTVRSPPAPVREVPAERSSAPLWIVASVLALAVALGVAGLLYARARAGVATTGGPAQSPASSSTDAPTPPTADGESIGASVAPSSVAPMVSIVSASASVTSSGTNASVVAGGPAPKKPGANVPTLPPAPNPPHGPGGEPTDEPGRPDPTSTPIAPKPDEEF